MMESPSTGQQCGRVLQSTPNTHTTITSNTSSTNATNTITSTSTTNTTANTRKTLETVCLKFLKNPLKILEIFLAKSFEHP